MGAAPGQTSPHPRQAFFQACLFSGQPGLFFMSKRSPSASSKTAWKPAIRRAGIHYYRFDDLRHVCNTQMMEAGIQQKSRKAIMGHSSGEEVNPSTSTSSFR